ncbi:MAG: aminotransferase class III-fold pyridoxal phosphate-dependent enzyme [Myxococcota bacterium]|nr:aminotransferase class III-fold pyridoxal phosphate-dependent enzyme [Myxococcota bacterium]
MNADQPKKPRGSREQKLLDEAAALLPASARHVTASPQSAMIIREGRGSRLFDLSGNEYLDYLLGSGPMLVGHAHPVVLQAVAAALERGASFLLPTESAVELAREVVRSTPCAERVVFGNTGSDGVIFAIRLARAYRKRDKVLKFEGAYHGQGDALLMSNQWTAEPAAFPRPVANSIGLPIHTQEEVLIAPWNDIDRTAEIITRYSDELACVIAEPMQRTLPPRPGFLEQLRELTLRIDVPLIFDEVVTGYRLGYGSGQGYYGVTPDLCVLGKSLSAGHPLSVVAGRRDLMQFAEGGRRLTGDYVSLTGTYSGNPISCTAALAALELLREPDVYANLFKRGQRLMVGCRKAFEAVGIPVQILGEPPAFEPWFADHEIYDFRSAQKSDRALSFRFGQALLDRGIVKGHEKFFVSIVHTDEDIDYTIDAIQDAAHELAHA